MKKLKLGVVPIKRSFLPMEAAKAQKDEFMPVIRSIKSDYVEIIDVDELTENGIAFTYEVIAPIVKKMKDNEIDALFLPFCDFGEESVAAGIASALKVPTLVWGPRDTVPNTGRSTWPRYTVRHHRRYQGAFPLWSKILLYCQLPDSI